MHSKLTRVLIALALVFFTSVALLGQRSLPDSALLTHRDIAHVEDLTDEHNETKRSISLYDAPHRALFEANPRYNSDAVATIWPSCSPYGGGARILPYCYVDEESETRLSWIVEQAIARWHEATGIDRQLSSLRIMPAPNCPKFVNLVGSCRCDLVDVITETLRISLGPVGGTSETSLGFMPGHSPTMTLCVPPLELPRDTWLRDSWVVTATHEFGHAIGFTHEHQRPGIESTASPLEPLIGIRADTSCADALNIDGEAPNAPIHLAIENMPGFDETMRDVAADYREPAFANLNPRQRMVRLFRDPDLAKKYWAPHWRRIMSWIPYTEDERRRAGLDISPQYDILSIMNHNGLHYIPGVGTARKGSTSMYNGAKLVPFATLGWYPPISPQNPTPPNDHLVWVGGNPNPGIAAISALDRARLHVLYPPSDLRHPMARTAPQNQSTGYTPAFRPVAVTMGTNTVTVRPAGPIPTGNDYFAAMGRMWQDLDKIYGLGMFGGPDTPGMVSTISNDSLLRGTGD